MRAVKTLRSKTVVLPNNDIDTDQIIPARFLTTTTRDGLGDNLFHDWRFASDGSENPQFVLNQHQNHDHRIMVAGNNFGCGSSREHAPWALLDYGIQAVISTEIADIFRSNALKNGLLPIVVDSSTHEWLLANPGAEIDIDVESSSLTLPNGEVANFPIDAFARYCLLQGVDQLEFIQQRTTDIDRFEEERTWKP
jgi:3-isopropylmalate/(R)-2-methylmalate dehydratase small subunit